MRNLITSVLLLIGFSVNAQTPSNEDIVNTLIFELRHYQRTNATPLVSVEQNKRSPAWISKDLNYVGPDYLEYRSREVLQLFNQQPQFFRLKQIQKADIATAGILIAEMEYDITSKKEKDTYKQIISSTNTIGDYFDGCAWLITYEINPDLTMLEDWGHIEGYSAVFTSFFTGSMTITDERSSTLGTHRISGSIDALHLKTSPQEITVIVYDDVHVLTKNISLTTYAPLCWGGGGKDSRYIHMQQLRSVESVFRPVRKSPCETLPGFVPQNEQPLFTDTSAVFTSTADTLYVSMYDNGMIDGDIISVTVDDSLIIPQYTLQRLEKGVLISTKNTTESTIEIRALAEGTSRPCTVTFFVEEMIEEGKRWGPYSLDGWIEHPIFGTKDRLSITIKKKSSQ